MGTTQLSRKVCYLHWALKLAYSTHNYSLTPELIVETCENQGVIKDAEAVIGAVVAITLCDWYGMKGLRENADWKRYPEDSFLQINAEVVGGLLDVLNADLRGLDSPLAQYGLVEPNGKYTNIHPVVRKILQI